MTNIRNTPKWLAFLIPIPLSVALLGSLGCSGNDNDPPPQSAEIASITVSKGELNPPYKDDVRSYSVGTFYSEASDFSLTVTLKDARGKLTINGAEAQSGRAFPVNLTEGANSIQIAVTGEDGKNFTSASISASVMKLNTKVYVLDGIGGAPVEGAMVTLKDVNNNVLEDNISLPANRRDAMLLGLDPAQKYHIYAKGKKSAEACFAYFDPSKESTAALYCLPGWAAPFVSEAPVIERISFADNPTAAAAWKDIPEGENQIAENHQAIPFIKITALSKNAIIYESGVGTAGPSAFPMQVSMDGKAWQESRFLTWWSIEAATPFPIGDSLYFRTTYVLPMPYTYISDGNITYAPLHTPDHWLDIVVYDQANNRTEQRLYLTLLDAAPQFTSDTDISGIKPSLYVLQGETFGASRNFSSTNPVGVQGVNPVDGYGVTSYNYLEFNLTDFTTTDSSETGRFPIIRGFEVYRSTDDVNFDMVDTIHYVAANRGLYRSGGSYSQRFAYNDLSPELTENVTYYYKIKAFNYNPAGNPAGYSRLSNALSNKLLPAFVTQLLEPAHNSVLSKTWPTFKFRISAPELLDPDISGVLYFSLVLKGMQDATYPLGPLFKTPFAVDCRNLDEEGNPWVGLYLWWYGYLDATYEDEQGNTVPYVRVEDDGAITIETDNPGFARALLNTSGNGIALNPGRAYEWNIFGEDAGIPRYTISFTNTNSAFFYKGWVPGADAPEGAMTRAFSFGSTYSYGLGSPEGFFIFTIDPAAD